jgi:hypothetical protein
MKVMKAIESLTIRRKLASFSSVFPHGDDAAVKNLSRIYNDVLEFLRSISSRNELEQNELTKLLTDLYIPSPSHERPGSCFWHR